MANQWHRARINGEWMMTKVVGQAIAVRRLTWVERVCFAVRAALQAIQQERT